MKASCDVSFWLLVASSLLACEAAGAGGRLEPEGDVGDNGGGGFVRKSRNGPFFDPHRRRKNAKKRMKFSEPRDSRPNIILMLTDDQDVELGSLKFMPKTLKLLRDEGAEFFNAYVTTPMCCPSRSSMLTGMYAHNHGVLTNKDNCSSTTWIRQFEPRTFAPYLSKAGYRTGYFGKYLNKYDGNRVPPGWREWVGLIHNSKFYNYTVNVNGKKVSHGFNYEMDYFPDKILNDSVQFLRQSKQTFPGKPVLIVMSFPGPHGPEDSAPQFQDMFFNITTHHTPAYDFAPNPDKMWILQEMEPMEPIQKRFTDLLMTKRLQTLLSVDDAVERVVTELANLGELENTYIIYTSDHGYHLGQFGLVKGKSYPFEFDIKVPFLVRGPGIEPGVRVPNVVLNIDLAPTFLDIGGVDIPPEMDGKSILPILERSEKYLDDPELLIPVGWRDSFLIERGKTRPSQGATSWNTLNLESLSNLAETPSRVDLIQIECQDPRHQGDCVGAQKWKCVYDGSRWRRQKCRNKTLYGKMNGTACVCDENIGLSRRELRRTIRAATPSSTRDFEGPDDEDAESMDGDPGEDARLMLDHAIGNVSLELTDLTDLAKAEQSTTPAPFGKWCRFTDAGSVVCTKSGESGANETEKEAWRRGKESIDMKIRELKLQLEELRILRKKLKEARPRGSNEGNSVHEVEPGMTTTTTTTTESPPEEIPQQCVCERKSKNQLDRERKEEVLEAEVRARQRMKQWKKDRKKKKRRKKADTCNLEKVNCFSHDNDHWQTPPLWMEGPMCACINANNNTYWCLRTINATHNLLYCQVITGLVMFFDLTIDPFELRNIAHSLTDEEADFFEQQLNILRGCAGAKDCTVRSSWEHRPRLKLKSQQRPASVPNSNGPIPGEDPASSEEDDDAQLLPDDLGFYDNSWSDFLLPTVPSDRSERWRKRRGGRRKRRLRRHRF